MNRTTSKLIDNQQWAHKAAKKLGFGRAIIGRETGLTLIC